MRQSFVEGMRNLLDDDAKKSELRALLDEGDDQAGEVLTEELVDLEEPPLLECCESMAYPAYDTYRAERTFEEKLRHACEMIRMAIMDEAYKGVGDDGRTMKKTQMHQESAWSSVEKLLMREVYPDRFKPLVDGAKAVIDEYMEK